MGTEEMFPEVLGLIGAVLLKRKMGGIIHLKGLQDDPECSLADPQLYQGRRFTGFGDRRVNLFHIEDILYFELDDPRAFPQGIVHQDEFMLFRRMLPGVSRERYPVFWSPPEYFAILLRGNVSR